MTKPSVLGKTQLFDRIIKLAFFKKDSESAVEIIDCPSSGIKPKISFSYKRVPGQFTYNCRLEVTNWFSLTNWYDYTKVNVVAGYRTASSVHTNSFMCQIFSSYKPLGGPDEPVIFECIVAEANSKLLEDYPYTLHYYNTKSTCADVIAEACKKTHLQAVLNVAPYLLESNFSASILEETFDSAYQVFNYIYDKMLKIAETKNESLQLIIYDKYIILQHRAEDGTVYPSKEVASAVSLSAIGVPILDQTTDVTFTAGTLSVTAPWNPDIFPGCIFYCSPALYTGSKALPNSVARGSDPITKTNCFYTITQEVKFSTTGNENQMKLLAVKMSNSPAAQLIDASTAKAKAEKLDADTRKQVDAYIAAIEELYKESSTEVTDIRLDAKEIQEAPAKSAWESSWMPASYDTYIIQLGDDLSTIASKFFPEDFKGRDRNSLQYTCAGFYFGYPIIALATYHYYRQSQDKTYLLDPNKPDDIIAGRKLIIPKDVKYVDFQDNTEVAVLFKEMMSYYEQKGKNQWRQPCKWIWRIMSEGVIDE